jgi:hypothetical protein
VVLAVGVMLTFTGAVSAFVHRHPTFPVLALRFLILIGVMPAAEGIENHIERGYIYFAMAFSLVVELLNLRLRKRAAPAPHDLTGVIPRALQNFFLRQRLRRVKPLRPLPFPTQLTRTALAVWLRGCGILFFC